MTPLVIGIDPGTKQSAYVEWDGEFVLNAEITSNVQVLKYLRSIDKQTCVVFESMEPYGIVVGRDVLETCVWIGRMFQRARDMVGPQQVSRLPRRAVKKHLRIGKGGDKAVRAALIQRLGGERHPEDWYGNLKTHQWSALAIAVTWWETERPRQPLKG
jgi:hypothetical protein